MYFCRWEFPSDKTNKKSFEAAAADKIKVTRKKRKTEL
jgi:hypothetical protein